MSPEDQAEVDRFAWFLRARGKPGGVPSNPAAYLVWMAQPYAQHYLGVSDDHWELMTFSAYHWLGA